MDKEREKLMALLKDRLKSSEERDNEIKAYLNSLADDKRREEEMLIKKLLHQEQIQKYSALKDAIGGI